MGVTAALGPLAAPAPAASPAPAWKLTAISAPTNFPSGESGTSIGGPAYLIEATNVGGASAKAPIMLQATMAPGLTPTAATGESDDDATPTPSCSIASRVVTCTTAGPLSPGRSLKVVIAVDVEAGLSGSVLSEAMVGGGGAAPRVVNMETPVASALAAFDFLPGAAGFASFVTADDGSPDVLAGGHPYQLSLDVGFPSRKAAADLTSAGHPREVALDLPRGLVVNPTVVPVTCTEVQLSSSTCPPASQVGAVTLTVTSSATGPGSDLRGLYAMTPPPGSSANFGFNAGDLGIPVHLLGSVRAGDYRLAATASDLLAKFPFLGIHLQLWGDPSSPSHDAVRGGPVPPQPRAFLTLPSACGPLLSSARTDSWEEPSVFVEREVENRDLEGNPVAVSGCGEVPFSPKLEARPTTGVADSPSGFDVNLSVPQNEAPDARASANLMRAEVSLPEGLVSNPAGANGLAGCSRGEIGLTSAAGSAPARFDAAPAACPSASRLGTAEVETPLLDQPLHGSVFLATPYDNPSRSLLALYVTAEDPASGVMLKLAGGLEANPTTGRLTAGFDELPQLPIAAVSLHFFGGATAPLRTPATCGVYSTASALVPWSAPESGPPASPSDRYSIDRPPSGSACARDESVLPSSPSLEAGTVSSLAGSYTPFVVDLKRPDGTQQISSLDLQLPPGLVGRLAGVPYCPEAALAAAQGRDGSAEQASPSCPAASRVGSATIGAGAGPGPYYVHGGVYLAGPYRGAPLSLATIVPAVAGPFDLGTVVIRSAVQVDPETARLSVATDAAPTILRGIPLDVRSVKVVLDRSEFIRAPTSCSPISINGLATSTVGAGNALSSRFQVGGCRRLGFKPRLALRLFGPVHRGAHPKLRTVFTPRPGDAAIRSAAVTLPATELLDSRHLGAICTRGQFAAGRCSAGSAAGYAKVWTPMLGHPLEGPVYLRASGGRLPDLAASLHGQVDLSLVSQVDSVRGRLRNTFRELPDIPLSRVVLTLRGGRHGLLVNTGGVCAGKLRGSARMIAQNGKAHAVGPVVGTSCPK